MKRILLIFLLLFSYTTRAQQEEIQWIGFEELEDSLKIESKPVVIYFYTDWCVYCKKMEKNAFKDRQVVQWLNQEFYAVKMNAESTEPVVFEGQTFLNEQARVQRNGIHQIPLLLAGRKDKPISFPVVMVLDENFKVRIKSHEYLTSEKMRRLLKS